MCWKNSAVQRLGPRRPNVEPLGPRTKKNRLRKNNRNRKRLGGRFLPCFLQQELSYCLAWAHCYLDVIWVSCPPRPQRKFLRPHLQHPPSRRPHLRRPNTLRPPPHLPPN